MEYEIVVEFPDSDVATGNELADDLQRDLRDDIPDANFSRRRTDPLSQDFGASLVILLGTPAVLTLAQGLKAWMSKRNDVSAEITIKTTGGEIRIVKIQGRIGKREMQLLTQFNRDQD